MTTTLPREESKLDARALPCVENLFHSHGRIQWVCPVERVEKGACPVSKHPVGGHIGFRPHQQNLAAVDHATVGVPQLMFFVKLVTPVERDINQYAAEYYFFELRFWNRQLREKLSNEQFPILLTKNE